jgi:hypothetical protein
MVMVNGLAMVDGWWLVAMVRPSSITISHQPSAMTGLFMCLL